jgi:hypothetical protein
MDLGIWIWEGRDCVIEGDLSYLNWGSDLQRDAYQALIELDIFSVLAEYDATLTGTFPLGIETPVSDLDIVCCVEDLAAFAELLEATYGYLEDFEIHQREKNGLPTVICRFRYRRLPVEIFGQARPAEDQRAYRHMLAEAALLRAGGEEAKEAIRQLRLAGLKTEPAFGRYFCLEGDPYESLLTLADASADEVFEVALQARIARRDRVDLLRPEAA